MTVWSFFRGRIAMAWHHYLAAMAWKSSTAWKWQRGCLDTAKWQWPLLIFRLWLKIEQFQLLFFLERSEEITKWPFTLNSASQPREPAAARANPPPGACNRLMGSRGTMIWGHGRCCHGDIGQSRWGREAAAHLVCVCCVVCCVCVRCFLPVNFGGEITVEVFVRSR